MLLLCGVFGCFRVCAGPGSWSVWFSVGADGVTADAWVLVFSRVGVGREGGRGPVSVGSLLLSFFCCVGRMAGFEPAVSTVGGWRSSW